MARRGALAAVATGPTAKLAALLAMAAVVLSAGGRSAAAQIVYSGQPSRISDGDTLTVAGRTIRLHGVDAPEMSQTCWDAVGAPYACGEVAREALVAQIGADSVSCTEDDEDRFGRSVGTCVQPLPDGTSLNLNDWLVRQGLAVAYRHFTTAYVEAEDEARQAQRGLWAGTFQYPWDFRNAPSPPPAAPAGTTGPSAAPPAAGGPQAAPPVGAPALAPAPAAGPCLIKGNISGSGKIYHVPGSPAYDGVVIDESRGERWFCSEEEAVAAGWRAPR